MISTFYFHEIYVFRRKGTFSRARFKWAFSQCLLKIPICVLQDNEVGQGSGYYNNQQFFKGKHGHSSFVPLCGLLKADDFENGSTASSGKLRRNKKLVDELDLKRRSNSQQQHLADYKMKQNLNRIKNSSNGSNEGSSDRAGTDFFSIVKIQILSKNSSTFSFVYILL